MIQLSASGHHQLNSPDLAGELGAQPPVTPKPRGHDHTLGVSLRGLDDGGDVMDLVDVCGHTAERRALMPASNARAEARPADELGWAAMRAKDIGRSGQQVPAASGVEPPEQEPCLRRD